MNADDELRALAAEIGATWVDQSPEVRSIQTDDGLILVIGPIAAIRAETPAARTDALDVVVDHFPVVGGWCSSGVYGECSCGDWDDRDEPTPGESFRTHLVVRLATPPEAQAEAALLDATTTQQPRTDTWASGAAPIPERAP